MLHWHKAFLLAMSGFCHGVLDIFALLGYGTVLTFQDSVLVPSSVVQILRRICPGTSVTNQPTLHNPQEWGSQSYWSSMFVMFPNQPLYAFAKWTTCRSTPFLFSPTRYEKQKINDNAADLWYGSIKISHWQSLLLIISYFVFKTSVQSQYC
jgi:hypothetical protein